MGVFVSLLVMSSKPWLSFYEGNIIMMSEEDDEVKGKVEADESFFDRLYMYPIFAGDRRLKKKVAKKPKVMGLKPVILHGNRADTEPVVMDLTSVLQSLDTSGDLSKDYSFLTTLMIAQFHEGNILVNYAFGYSNSVGKCYFYKEGNLEKVLEDVCCLDENLNETNVPSRKAFLSYLHQLMNTLTGSVWLNGFCIHGPENPSDRIEIQSMRVRSIPARVTMRVKDLSGVHCIRTKNRLEVYGKTGKGSSKSLWFRGENASSLIVTEVADQVMSVLVPPWCPDLSTSNQHMDI